MAWRAKFALKPCDALRSRVLYRLIFRVFAGHPSEKAVSLAIDALCAVSDVVLMPVKLAVPEIRDRAGVLKDDFPVRAIRTLYAVAGYPLARVFIPEQAKDSFLLRFVCC